MKRALLLLSLFFLFLGIDAASKAWVHETVPLMSFSSHFYPYGGIAIFQDWHGIDFSINHILNRGAAWGMFGGWQGLLVGVRILIICSILCYLFFGRRSVRAHHFPFLLILSGAVGNVIDYFIYGQVVDMFLFRFWGYTYPLFNIADSMIFCGVAWLFLQSLKKPKEKTQASAS